MGTRSAQPAATDVQPPRVVVIGGSAGALEALQEIVAGLPADLDAALFVVVHLPALSISHLPSILTRAGALPAETATDGAPLVAGTVHVAPPDHHVTLLRDAVRVLRGPRENGCRPAIDPLFRTAALHHRERAMGVILSGLLDDGSGGLAAIRRQGGVCVVQQPEDAEFAAMPENAIRRAEPQHVVPAAEIAGLIERFASASAGAAGAGRTEEATGEVEHALGASDQAGRPTGFSCPECHGVLWETPGDELSFVCRVGHRMSAESLAELHTTHLDGALWAAYRALEEQASLCELLADRMAQRGGTAVAGRFRERAVTARRQAEIMREALLAKDDRLRSAG